MVQIRKRGKHWQATVRGPDGRERTKTYPKKVDAERWADSPRADIARGQWVDPRLGRTRSGSTPKVGASVKSTSRRLLPKSRLTCAGTYYQYSASGPSPLSGRARCRRLSTTLSPATVEVIARWLSAILGAAVRDGMIGHSPYRDVRLPRVEAALVEPLPTEAVAALADAVPARYRALVATAAGTGLRQGEAFGLTAPRVDFLRRQLRVEKQLVLVPAREPHTPRLPQDDGEPQGDPASQCRSRCPCRTPGRIWRGPRRLGVYRSRRRADPAQQVLGDLAGRSGQG